MRYKLDHGHTLPKPTSIVVILRTMAMRPLIRETPCTSTAPATPQREDETNWDQQSVVDLRLRRPSSHGGHRVFLPRPKGI